MLAGSVVLSMDMYNDATRLIDGNFDGKPNTRCPRSALQYGLHYAPQFTLAWTVMLAVRILFMPDDPIQIYVSGQAVHLLLLALVLP